MPGSGSKNRRGHSGNQHRNQPAVRSSSGQTSRPASSKTERKPPVRERAGGSAGVERYSAVPAEKKQAAAKSGASGALTVKERQTTAASASKTSDPAKTTKQKKMDNSGGAGDEEMEWETTPGTEKRTPPQRDSGASFDGASFFEADKSSVASGQSHSVKTKDQYHEETRTMDRSRDGQTPSASGGEGDYESSDTPDSDSEYENLTWEGEKQTTKPSLYDANRTWKGVPLGKLKTTPTCLPHNLKLERSSNHYIAIKLPFEHRDDQLPAPFHSPGQWDADHVRMPYAHESKCVVNGSVFFLFQREERRWDVIVRALNEPIQGPFELEEAILKYNQRYINKWKFTILHHFFIKHVSYEEREQFFKFVLPEMIHLAKKLPDICPMPIPLLKRGKPKKLTLSQHQISCLLANAFLCTFPLRYTRTDYPDINFSHLFVGDPNQRKLQKLQCIVNYFKRVLYKPPTGIVTFSRQELSGPYNWSGSMDNLTQLHVSSTGTIEDNGKGMLQVDFANKYIGGGVLGYGCVQEEIRFMICPEMIIARLFTQKLDDRESLIMTGCERFSEYEGYSDTFRWKGDYVDTTPRDCLGRLCCEVVAIDAQVFRSDHSKQFKRSSLERELNKAYSGFKTSANEANRSAVCTGNWGCGAFGGDKQAKSLIQVMAASVAKRDVCYFTFDDEQLTKDFFEVHDQLCRKRKTVGDVFSLLEDYNRLVINSRRSRMTLFEFIRSELDREKFTPPTTNFRQWEGKDSSVDGVKTSHERGTWFDK